MSDLEEYKARKNGEATLRVIIEELYKNQDKLESLVYVIKKRSNNRRGI